MRKIALGVLFVAAGLVAAGYSIARIALGSPAQAQDAQVAEGEGAEATATGKATTRPMTNPPEEELIAGVWREGKAVFSDWKFLDFPMKEEFTRGYKPEQPIKYSHALHVEKLNIECQYCHSGVHKSSYATVPALEVCMGCHLNVATDRPEVKKMREEYWDKNRPIPWVPVNNLQEHVQFNHQRHIKAGVGCQNCHGQVQKMEVVERVSSLKMGFCVSCHREQGASIDCGICHY